MSAAQPKAVSVFCIANLSSTKRIRSVCFCVLSFFFLNRTIKKRKCPSFLIGFNIEKQCTVLQLYFFFHSIVPEFKITHMKDNYFTVCARMIWPRWSSTESKDCSALWSKIYILKEMAHNVALKQLNNYKCTFLLSQDKRSLIWLGIRFMKRTGVRCVYLGFDNSDEKNLCTHTVALYMHVVLGLKALPQPQSVY